MKRKRIKSSIYDKCAVIEWAMTEGGDEIDMVVNISGVKK